MSASWAVWWAGWWPVIHGVLMAAAFLVFIPLGIVAAYFRWTPSELRAGTWSVTRTPRRVSGGSGAEEWLDSHVTIMLFGVLLSVLGWLIAFLSVNVNFRSTHALVGTGVMFAVVFVQPHLAYDETAIKWRHRYFGYALAAAAVVNIALGCASYLRRAGGAGAGAGDEPATDVRPHSE